MEYSKELIKRTDFEREVQEGLTDFPKHLSSKYFYDEIGDKLFQDIMKMPTYYLTSAEYSILLKHKKEIAELFSSKGAFDLIELGAGDGKKTKIVLKELGEQNSQFTYIPIDISINALQQLTKALEQEIPKLKIEGFQGTYFEALADISTSNTNRKIILFLGSNIGNFSHEQAIIFLQKINELMRPDDLLFIGFDQKKNPQTILDAYNDHEGITAAFNKNILKRINTDLNGDFDLDTFLHWEVYNPETGAAKSYLVSKIKQTVNLKKLDLHIKFKAWETIHTEVSQKYDDEMVKWLAKEAGLKIHSTYTTQGEEFKNYVFVKE